jgi:predicted DNA-binding protein (MmcQ/YjbR family)
MDLAAVCAFCQDLPGSVEDTPFGPDVLVYKVGGKLFALTDPGDHPPRVNLKCDPDRAVELREEYDAVRPGYHMNKKHWNTVILDGSVPSPLVRDLVRHSYDLVVSGLPAAQRKLMA